MQLQLIEGNIGIMLQFVGLSTLGISTLLFLIEWTNPFNKHANKKIHKKKNSTHEKQWFFDVEEKIA